MLHISVAMLLSSKSSGNRKMCTFNGILIKSECMMSAKVEWNNLSNFLMEQRMHYDSIKPKSMNKQSCFYGMSYNSETKLFR